MITEMANLISFQAFNLPASIPKIQDTKRWSYEASREKHNFMLNRSLPKIRN